MGSGLLGSLPSYLLYHLVIYYCIFLIWLIKIVVVVASADGGH